MQASQQSYVLSNVYEVLPLGLSEHELLSFAHDRKLPDGGGAHGVGHLRGSDGAREAGVVVAVDAPGQAVHHPDRSLRCLHIPIGQVL